MDIRTHHWTNDTLRGVISYATSYSNFEFPRHFHNYYTIQIVDEGINKGFTNHNHYELGPDSILIINPGEVHAGKSISGTTLRFRALAVEEYFLKKILAENELVIDSDLIFCNQPIYNQVLTNKLKLLLDGFQCNVPSLDLQIRSLDFFVELFSVSLIGKLQGIGNREVHFIDKAKHFIKENYHYELTLKTIAASCCISEFHLVRQFKSKCGLTPFEYIRNYRVEKAMELLNLGYSITETAVAVGFYDHSHFIRNFKKITGILPSQYPRQA